MRKTGCWVQHIISLSLGKMFTCIWKILFGSFRKYYGLCTLDLTLAKFQRLKIQDTSISLFTQKCFWYLPTISHEQVSPMPIKHTIFCSNSVFLVYLTTLPKRWQSFCCYQQKIQKNRNFWYFKDDNHGSKHDN